MKWIGLTGGIASGKSSVSAILRSLGYDVIDADQLARDVVAKGQPAHNEIKRAFGLEVVTADDELDRKRLGEIVFSDPSKRQLLESITHPRIRQLTQEKRNALQAQGKAVAFYDVPLLFEKNMASLFDSVVAVVCSRETQLTRLVARDGLSLAQAEKRLLAQMPIEDKAKLANTVIINEGTLADLERAVKSAIR